MKVTSSKDNIEFAELSKLITKARQIDVRNFNMTEIEKAVEKGTSIKSVEKKLYLAQNKMHAVKDKQGNVTKNFSEIGKRAEDFYSELYSSQTDHTTLIAIESKEDTEMPRITSDEVKKAVEGITRGKAAGQDGITADLIKDGGDILLEKLASLFRKCIKTSSAPRSWKNANPNPKRKVT